MADSNPNIWHIEGELQDSSSNRHAEWKISVPQDATHTNRWKIPVPKLYADFWNCNKKICALLPNNNDDLTILILTNLYNKLINHVSEVNVQF